DCGQMSSWYVFSALGFYPVNPAQGVYAFGSPIVDSAVIRLEKGKIFTVKTINNSLENKYIQSISLNGKSIKRNYITHKEIMKGCTLVFTMGKSPNKDIKNTMATSSIVYH
ncbi:MAG: glycoside hydrolase family 92 protein, partial [Flavobacterium sp.]|nr:glycoside hydrolase family 92 protein [Flavobacterium sp.]